MKTCTKCGIPKEEGEFHHKTATTFMSWCKECRVGQRRTAYLRRSAQESESYKAWRLAHPEAARAKSANYRARKLTADGAFSADDVVYLYTDQQQSCAYCGNTLLAGYHVEHRIPLIRGGSNSLENLCLACPTCNLRKGAKTDQEFLAILQREVGVEQQTTAIAA